MKLYYKKGACSLAVRILIHELGIPCEFEAVDLKTKKTETGADFLKINPKGAVPTLVLDNKEVLTENAVIQQYLADHQKANHLLPATNDLKRYRVLEWLNFVSTDLHKNCAPFYNPNMPEDVKENIYKPIVRNKLTFVEQHLMQNPYIAGKEFTLPDSYLFVVLSWMPSLKIDLTEWPHVNKYFANIKNRKSVQQSLQEEGL